MVKISIVVPTLNEEVGLPLSLNSLLNQTVKPFEVLYVDGGSTDGTVCVIEDYAARAPNIKYVVKNGMGIDASHNFGAGICHGDIVLFTNADIVFPSNTLELVSKHFDSDSELVALTGMPIPIMAPALLRFEYVMWATLKVLFSGVPHPLKVFITSSSFLAVKTDIFLGMGGFDSEYVNSDGAFGIKLMRERSKGLYCPEIGYYTSSRRYNKAGALKFNKIFFYNVLEDFAPVIAKFKWLDGFRRALHSSHKPVT